MDNALGTVGTIAFALSTTLQDARSGRSIRMRHAAIGMWAMFSAINQPPQRGKEEA